MSTQPVGAGLAEDMPHFTCPECEATSYHPQDVEHGYCGRCRRFTRDRHLSEQPDQIEIKLPDLSRVALEPGDVLLVRHADALTHQEAALIKRRINQVFPGHEILIITGQAELSVIRQADPIEQDDEESADTSSPFGLDFSAEWLETVLAERRAARPWYVRAWNTLTRKPLR